MYSVTVLQDYSIKNKFPTAGYMNILVPKLLRCNLGIQLVD
jgi:hypothetical protein